MIKQAKKTIAKVLLTSMVLTMAPAQVALPNATSAYAEVEAATVTYTTVKSQKALDKALKNKKIKTIYLSDNKGKNVSYKISGKHSDKKIVVQNYHAKLKFSKDAEIKSLTVYVTTQKQLDQWLSNERTTEIVIKTTKAREFTIDEKDYSAIKLTVEAKNSTIKNEGTFKKVKVKKGEYISSQEEKVTVTPTPTQEIEKEKEEVTPTPITTPTVAPTTNTGVIDTGTVPINPSSPIVNPTTVPTEIPVEPTTAPTEIPVEPTTAPTETPIEPTTAPTETPIEPTTAPTETPIEPTTVPTETPVEPTTAPTETPIEPTETPNPGENRDEATYTFNYYIDGVLDEENSYTAIGKRGDVVYATKPASYTGMEIDYEKTDYENGTQLILSTGVKANNVKNMYYKTIDLPSPSVSKEAYSTNMQLLSETIEKSIDSTTYKAETATGCALTYVVLPEDMTIDLKDYAYSYYPDFKDDLEMGTDDEHRGEGYNNRTKCYSTVNTFVYGGYDYVTISDLAKKRTYVFTTEDMSEKSLSIVNIKGLDGNVKKYKYYQLAGFDSKTEAPFSLLYYDGTVISYDSKKFYISTPCERTDWLPQ